MRHDLCESIWNPTMNFAFERREMFKDRVVLWKSRRQEVILFFFVVLLYFTLKLLVVKTSVSAYQAKR